MKRVERLGRRTGLRASVLLLAGGALGVAACAPNPEGAPSGSAGGASCSRRAGAADFTAGHLDYDAASLWLCAPGCQPNACDTNIDATEYLADGTTRLVPHVAASQPSFDCFYVYPTVALSGTGNMTDLSDVTPMLDPLLSQGAQFTSMCRVYAPLYRQATIGSISDPASLQRAYDDVKDAFAHYLANDSGGRDFVLLGHSQGSMHLQRLIAETIDLDAALRARMISALLIGDPLLTVPVGQRVGGTFKNVPLCSRASERGCVVAYSSYPKEAPAGPTSAFGHPPAGSTGLEVGCTSPSTLLGRTGTLGGVLLPLHVSSPTFLADTPPGTLTAPTPFALFRNMFRAGDCVDRAGVRTLEVSVDRDPADTRAVPPYRESQVEAAGFGMHIVDYNLPIDELLALVAAQAATPR